MQAGGLSDPLRVRNACAARLNATVIAAFKVTDGQVARAILEARCSRAGGEATQVQTEASAEPVGAVALKRALPGVLPWQWPDRGWVGDDRPG